MSEPDSSEQIIGELISKYWSTVIIALILVMIASLILVFIMRWIATPLLWTYIVLLELTYIFGNIEHFVLKFAAFLNGNMIKHYLSS